MSDFDIGLSGLNIAQRAIELIGTNIANAASDGYHVQDIRVAPVEARGLDAVSVGGAEIADSRRRLDVLLEMEILRSRPQAGQLSAELETVQAVEGALGTVDSQNLASALTDFYNGLRELAAQPDSLPLRQQAVRAGETLSNQFRNLSSYLADLKAHVATEADQVVEQVNGLVDEIARLNGDIEALEIKGGSANLLKDKRDQAVLDLAELVDVRTSTSSDRPGVVNVWAYGTPLVTTNSATLLEAGIAAGEELGISVQNAGFYFAGAAGGRLGGLLAAHNEILPSIQTALDDLAGQIIDSLNAYHVGGVGTSGSFTELTGQPVSSATIGQWDRPVTAGEFHVRVLDADGAVSRFAIAVDPAADTLASVAARLNATGLLTASIVDSALHLQADSGYHFDFLPAVTPAPTTSTLTGTSEPTLSGIYTGSNQTYTCTVVGTGTVGLSPVSVQVRNGNNELVRTLELGPGYAAGDRLVLDQGLEVAFSAGTVNDGTAFTVQALSQSDQTGLLSALGLNAFFLGHSAGTIEVDPLLLEDPRRLATSIGPEMADNVNGQRMAQLGEDPSEALGGATPTEFCHQLVFEVGLKVQTRRIRQENLTDIAEQLNAQRDRVSGVDVNEQAAQLLVFERMFQSMAKFIEVKDRSLQSLLEII